MTETSLPVQELNYGPRGQVRVFTDVDALALGAADAFAAITSAAVATRSRAYVALSGGSTPKRMGELLAVAPFRDRVPWESLEVFWGDERWVPEESPESNAGVAKRTFLDHVPIPPSRVNPFPTGVPDPETAATMYATQLRTVFGQTDDVPRFDLVLLGMGDDGHTASLFPGTAVIHETEALAVAHAVPKLGAVRLTLTPPVLNAGREVVFLVAGAEKAETLASVLEGPEKVDELPSQIIRPVDGRLTWLVDRAAAARLKPFAGAVSG